MFAMPLCRTFIPLLLMFPACDVPTFEVSLHASLDPALHFRIGQALSPLCDEGACVKAHNNSPVRCVMKSRNL